MKLITTTSELANGSSKNANSPAMVRLQAVATQIRQGLLSLFAAVNLSAASSIGPKYLTISTVIQTLQWLWFALATSAAFPWTSSYISWLRAITKIARFDLFITDEGTTSVPLAATIALLVVVLLLYTAGAFICWQLLDIDRHHVASLNASVRASLSETQGRQRHEDDGADMRDYASRSVLLQLFTITLKWGTSVLFLPVSALLIGTIRCSKSETRCFEGSHLASAVMGMLTLALWLPLCFLYVAFKFPRGIVLPSIASDRLQSAGSPTQGSRAYQASTSSSSSSSNDYSAQAHNRLALFRLLSSSGLLVAFELATSQSNIARWGLAAGFLTVASINLAASLWCLPFINRYTQALDVASSSLLTWSGLCLIIALLFNDEEQVVASVLLLMGAPLVVALAQFLLVRRKEFLIYQPISAIQDQMLVEVRLRLELQHTQERLMAHVVTAKQQQATAASNATNSELKGDSAHASSAFGQLVQEVTLLCKTSASPLLCLQLARMCSSLPAARQRIAMLLQLAATRDPALDVQFGLYCLQQSLDESLGQDMKDLSVQRYLRFQALSTAASQQVIVAARCQKAFFGELASNEPNVERMTKEGVTMNQAMTLAHRQFEQALHLYRSPQVMRQYGSFLLHLLNDQSGQTTLHQADQLERILKTKSSRTMAALHDVSVDEIFHEDTAVLSISGVDGKQFGVITSANQGACSMFGCAIGDLVGAPVSTIIPAPFNGMHDGFLRAYLQAERPPAFITRTQHVFACRRNGTIFPVAMRVRQVSGGVQDTAFIAVISELKMLDTEHYLLYEAASNQIKAVSAGCAALLGIDVHTLSQAKPPVTVQSVLPSWVRTSAHVAGDEHASHVSTVAENHGHITLDVGQSKAEFAVSEVAMNFASVDVRALKLTRQSAISISAAEVAAVSLCDVKPENPHEDVVSQGDASEMEQTEVKHDSSPQLHVLIESPSHAVQMLPILHDPSPAGSPSELLQSTLRRRGDAGNGTMISSQRRSRNPTRSPEASSGSRLRRVNIAAEVVSTEQGAFEETPADEQLISPEVSSNDKKDGGKALSQAGSNTTNSSVGYNAAMSTVRKLALSEEAPMEPSIKCLQRFIRLTFIVVLVMSVVGFAMVRSSVVSLESSIKNIHEAGSLRSNIVQVRTSISSFLLANEGLRAPLSAAAEAAERSNIRRAVQRGSDMHKRLYLERSSLGGALEALYTENSTPMEELVAGVVTITNVNVWDGVNRVLAAGARLVETPANGISHTNPDVFLIQENTEYHDHLFEAIMQVILLYQERAELDAKAVIQTQAILMATAIAVLILIVMLVYPPVVRRVNQTAQQVFELFLDISPVQIIEIARSREEVLVTLGVGSELGDEAFGNTSLQQELLNNDRQAQGDVGTDPNKRSGKSIKNRKLITSARRTVMIAAKVLFLCAGATAYFALSFKMEYLELTRQYHEMVEQAYVARRNTLLGDVGLSSRDYLMAAFRPTLFRPLNFGFAGEAAKERMAQLAHYQQALLFGDEQLELYGSIRTSAELDELNFGNACKFITSELAVSQNFGDLTQKNCTAVGKGVLTNGLNGAVQLYLQLVGAVITLTDATQGVPSMAQLIASIATPDFVTLSELLFWWLPAGFSIETNIYFQEQINSLERFVALRCMMLAVFLSALALCVLFMFEPLVYEMDMHVKRVRALLVMIPAEVAMSTASLRKALVSAL